MRFAVLAGDLLPLLDHALGAGSVAAGPGRAASPRPWRRRWPPCLDAGPPDLTWPVLVLEAVRSLLVGALLAFAINLVFTAVRYAGSVAGMQIGFAIVNAFDPRATRRSRSSPSSTTCWRCCCSSPLDAHHILVAAMVTSPAWRCRRSRPTGRRGRGLVPAARVRRGLRAGPADRRAGGAGAAAGQSPSMGVIVKTVPQINVLVVGFPIKIAVGLVDAGPVAGLLHGMVDPGAASTAWTTSSRGVLASPLIGTITAGPAGRRREEVRRWPTDTAGERTEKATGKRREKAREKGQVATSAGGQQRRPAAGGHDGAGGQLPATSTGSWAATPATCSARPTSWRPSNLGVRRIAVCQRWQVLVAALARRCWRAVLVAGLGGQRRCRSASTLSAEALAFQSEKLNPITGMKSVLPEDARFFELAEERAEDRPDRAAGLVDHRRPDGPAGRHGRCCRCRRSSSVGRAGFVDADGQAAGLHGCCWP